MGVQNPPEAGWIGMVFLCRHSAGNPIADGVETDRAAYLSLREMDRLSEPFEPWSLWVACRVLRGEYQVIPGEPNNPFRPRLAFL
jgi:hypothetical protein